MTAPIGSSSTDYKILISEPTVTSGKIFYIDWDFRNLRLDNQLIKNNKHALCQSIDPERTPINYEQLKIVTEEFNVVDILTDWNENPSRKKVLCWNAFRIICLAVSIYGLVQAVMQNDGYLGVAGILGTFISSACFMFSPKRICDYDVHEASEQLIPYTTLLYRARGDQGAYTLREWFLKYQNP